jgi:hypothetical protein
MLVVRSVYALAKWPSNQGSTTKRAENCLSAVALRLALEATEPAIELVLETLFHVTRRLEY